MKEAGSLKPWTSASSLSFLIAFTSSGERVISAPLAFSSMRWTLRHPGIGTTDTISALETGKEDITRTVVVLCENPRKRHLAGSSAVIVCDGLDLIRDDEVLRKVFL